MKIEEAHRLHRELWGWLAETGDDCKGNWPEWKFNGGKVKEVRHSCFPCEVARKGCPKCQITWGPDNDDSPGAFCQQPSSPWEKWRHKERETTRKRLAAIIRDLPWKYEKKETTHGK